jgi:O-antigen ligase
MGALSPALRPRSAWSFPRATGGPIYAHAHNAGLNVLVQFGVLGLAGFSWLGIRLAGLLWSAAVRGTGEDRFLGVGLAGIFPPVALHGMADDTPGINTMAALLFAFCGCAVVLARRSTQP